MLGLRRGTVTGISEEPADTGRLLEDDPCFRMCAFAVGEVVRDKLAA